MCNKLSCWLISIFIQAVEGAVGTQRKTWSNLLGEVRKGFYSLTFRIKSSRMSKRLTEGAGHLGQKKLYVKCEVIKQHVNLGEN